MIILVGAGGFLGYSLARHFSNKGIHFATISRSFQWLPALFERRFIGSASEAGDFFGERALLMNERRSADVYAHPDETQDLVCLTLGRRHFEKVCCVFVEGGSG